MDQPLYDHAVFTLSPAARRLLLVLATCFALAFGLQVPAQAAPGDGTLQGRVLNEHGAPVVGVFVEAFHREGGPGYGTDMTDAAGRYAITVPAGVYSVCAGGRQEYFSACEDGVRITAGGDTTQNFALVPVSHFIGTVTGVDGEPLRSIEASAYQQDASGAWQRINLTRSNRDGDYDIQVRPGAYRLGFRDRAGHGYITEYFDNAATIESATTVTIGQRSVQRHAVTMERSGGISGHVDLGVEDTSRPAVTVLDTAGHLVHRGRIRPNGDYTVWQLGTGSYHVAFNRVSGMAGTAAEFYDGHTEESGFAAGDPVPVVTGEETTGIDASLAPGGHLVGSLRSDNGEVLGHCYVQAYTRDHHLVTRTAYTDDDGSFDIGGLTTGSYRVRVVTDRRSDCDNGAQYYTGVARLSAVRPDAVLVPVTIGATSRITPRLVYASSGQIGGHVSLPSGANRRDRQIRAVDLASGKPAATTYAASDGTYVLRGLATGSYRVVFGRVSGPATAAGEFYDNQPEGAGRGAAEPVPVTAGDRVPDIDAVLATGGLITGRLVDENGSPLSCHLQAFTRSGRLVTRSDDSQSFRDGAFSVGGLSTGQYRFRVAPSRFSQCDAGRQYLTDSGTGLVRDPSQATLVNVTRGQTVDLPTDVVYDTTAPALPTLKATAPPSVSGTPQAGVALTANPGSWGPAGVTFTYQWRTAAGRIPGATAQTYTPVAGDVGQPLTVRVRARKPGYLSGTADSPATAPVAAAGPSVPPIVVPPPAAPSLFTLGAKPSIKGMAQVGHKLKYAAGAVSPAPISVTFQWLRNGKPIAKATTSRYKLKTADRGKKISLQVTYAGTGLTTLVTKTKKTKKVKAAPHRGHD